MKYFCPNCKKEQTSVVQWQTVSIASEFNLETKNCDWDIDREGGNHESWNCPECREELPTSICRKIEDYLWD